MTKNNIKNKRTKHIEVKYFWIRQQVEEDRLRVEYCPTNEMIADIFTKPLGRTNFEMNRDRLRVVNLSQLVRDNIVNSDDPK